MSTSTWGSCGLLGGVVAGVLAAGCFSASAVAAKGGVNVVNSQVVVGDGVVGDTSPGTVVGNGRRIAKAFPMADAFRGIELAGVFEAEITCGKAAAVDVTADENLLPLVEVVVRDGTLSVRFTKPVRMQKPPKLKIALPALDSLSLSGGDEVRVADVKGKRFQLTQNGNGAVTVTGKAESFVCTVGGVGEVDAGKLKCDEAAVTVNGVGNVVCRPEKKLTATLSGVGGVRCLTRPPVVEQNRTGLGEVEFSGK